MNYFILYVFGELMYYDEEKERQKRQHNREVVDEWKTEARAIRAADPSKQMLLREAKYVALKRIEDAARTVSDFENVKHIWDYRERVRSWTIDNYESLILDVMNDFDFPESGMVIPEPFNNVWWRQLQSGDFLSYIFDCPHEIQEHTASRPVFDYTSELSEDQKEILYYWAIRRWTPQQIAVYRNQTDRNIRKVYNFMIADIRKKIFKRLAPRYFEKLSLTYEQKQFCKSYWEQLDNEQRKEMIEYLIMRGVKFKFNDTGDSDDKYIR